MCILLSKVRDLIIKNTTPRSTGSADTKKPFLPNRQTHSAKRTLHAMGKTICVHAKDASLHIPQQPMIRKTTAMSMSITAPCPQMLLLSI